MALFDALYTNFCVLYGILVRLLNKFTEGCAGNPLTLRSSRILPLRALRVNARLSPAHAPARPPVHPPLAPPSRTVILPFPQPPKNDIILM